MQCFFQDCDNLQHLKFGPLKTEKGAKLTKKTGFHFQRKQTNQKKKTVLLRTLGNVRNKIVTCSHLQSTSILEKILSAISSLR